MIRAEGLRKAFRRPDGSRVQALAHVNLSVSPGEIVAVVGARGTGKTTLLRLLAGLEQPDAGRLVLRAPRPDRPLTAMAFQNDSLFPWLTVAGNIAYGLRLRRWPRLHQRDAVAHFGRRLGLSHLLNAYPDDLTPACRRRVAVARALAHDPELLLLDEPFTGQDPESREHLVQEIQAMYWARRPAVVYSVRTTADLLPLEGQAHYFMQDFKLSK